MPMLYPSKDEIELPLLKAIVEWGGQAKPSQLYDNLAAVFGLLLEQRVAKSKTAPSQTQSKWENDVQDVRDRLVKKGELAPTEVSGFGVWRITPKGEARIARHNAIKPERQSVPVELKWRLGKDYAPIRPKQAEAARVLMEQQEVPCMVATSGLTEDEASVWEPAIFAGYDSDFGTITALLTERGKLVKRNISDRLVRMPSAVSHELNLMLLAREEDFFKAMSARGAVSEQVKQLLETTRRTRNILLYGPPGTGKTWLVTQFARAFTDADKVEMVTLHQSFAYEEFVEGIKPVNDEKGQVLYRIESGIFKRICHRAMEDLDGRYLLIIDEINRANIAKVLGELITLIEDDKRLTRDNAIEVRLPYSRERFGVPPNLTILGTMNTADRSIALLDLALRRRFTFVEMPPKPELLSEDVEGVNLQALLTRLNKRVGALLDPDHRIGHSYLMGVETEDDLHFAWYRRIVPLLQEYFYHDGERLQAVVGKAFVTETTPDPETVKALGNLYEEGARYEVVELEGEAFLAALRGL